MPTRTDYKATLIKGAIWSVGTRWAIRGLGFLNTIIMARLLMPQDYGLVAMATMALGLVQASMDFNAAAAVLRKGDLDRAYTDSAWTLNVLQGLGIGAVLAMLAPLASLYYGEPQVKYILWVLAVFVPLNASANIGVVLAQKTFQFSLEFRLAVVSRILGVIATLAGGFWLGDYRALVMGIVTGYIASFVLSYLMHPYRPRLDFSRLKDIWKLTKWLMFSGFGYFLMRRSDELVAARVGGAGTYGVYHVGADLGSLAVGELGPAMMRALLPILATIKEDADRATRAVLRAFAAANAITLPVAVGLAAISDPLTLLLLGREWTGVAFYMAGFAVIGALQFMMTPVNNLLLLRGMTRHQNRLVWIEFAVFLLALALLVPSWGLPGLVGARLAGAIAGVLMACFYAHRYSHIPFGEIVGGIWRSALGAALMYLLVIGAVAQFNNPFIQVLVGVLTGLCMYTGWSLATWLLTGRPEGLESTVLDMVKKRRNSGGLA